MLAGFSFKGGNINKLRNLHPIDFDNTLFLSPPLLLLPNLFFAPIFSHNTQVKNKNPLINQTSGNEAIL